MRTAFIVNLRSGAARSALPGVQAFADELDAAVSFTERPAHASELAARALDAGCGRVVAVGGDGTMNEVARVLTGTGATLGLVPCGSGDGLGRHLGLHGPPAHALQILRHGRTRLIDTGLADGHPFFTVAGLGFEAEISARFNRLARRGFLRYLTTSARAFADYSPVPCRITHAAGTLEVRAFTLAVANTDQYGNNACIAPSARAEDGQLDLTVIPPVSALNALPLLVRLFCGTLDRDRSVTRLRGTHFTIEHPHAGLIHTDGETHLAGSRVEFSLRPASLRIQVPA